MIIKPTNTWGDLKIPGIVKKKYLLFLYKFETLVLFEVLPPETGCSNPSTAPNVSNIGSGAGIVASSLRAGVLRRGLKLQTCTNTLNNFF